MKPSNHQILTLARAGNPVRAWVVFGEQGLGDVSDDPKTLTLKGRLLKDLADRSNGAERNRLYHKASEAYLAAYNLKTDSYPLINAATLALLAGDTAQSQTLSRQVLDLIEADPAEGETPYWREATRAEALLLLEQRRQAKDALSAGIAKLPEAWEDHAATIGQFERIATARDENADWLDAFRPPCSVHFSGLIGLDPDDAALQEAITDTVATSQPGFGFGALAAGADIMIAEALIETGAQLHAVLPCPVEEFRAVSVEPSGADWGSRFDALVGQAATIRIAATGHAGNEEAGLSFDRCTLAAMGQAMRQAEVLRSSAQAITVAATGEPPRMPITLWGEAGLAMTTIATARASSTHSPRANGQSSQHDALQSALTRTGENTATHLDLGAALDDVGAQLEDEPDATFGLVAGSQIKDLPEQLARVAPSGMIACDWQTAMACKVVRPEIRMEELGELTLATGPISLWSIIP